MDKIRLIWFRPKNGYNVGDEIALYICNRLSDRNVQRVELEELWKEPEGEVFIVVGSIISFVAQAIKKQREEKGKIAANVVVWGCGLMRWQNPGPVSLDFRAVRGPLTRNVLVKKGYHVGMGEGDPALLMPQIFQPEVSKTYDVGVIPHLYDYERGIGNQHPFLTEQRESWVDPETGLHVRRIDVRTHNVEEFITELKSCKYIFSVSLHGLILAEAYNVPYSWFRFQSSGRQQSEFKYADFFAQIARTKIRPFDISNRENVQELLDNCPIQQPKRTPVKSLLDTCPFLDSSMGLQLL